MLPYILTLARIRYYISKKFFYALGIRIASHPFIILFSFLFIISYASYPIVFDPPPNQHAVKNYIDGHLWQATPHTSYFPINNLDTDASEKLPSVEYIAQQVVLSSAHTDNGISQQLLQNLLSASLSVYKSITISHQLRSVCALTPQRQCIIHSPFSLWNYDEQQIESDDNISYTMNQHIFDSSKVTGLPLHPTTFMGNITQDRASQHFTTANAIILTFILKNTEYTMDIWEQVWDRVVKTTEYPIRVVSTTLSSTVEPYLIQYKLKVLPNVTLSRTSSAILIVSSIALYIFIRNQFSKSKLLKSHSGLGVAALFLSGSCYTLTIALLQQLNTTTTAYIDEDICFSKLIVCISTTVEHILLITQAVVARERKDIRVNERVGKGLQQVGIQMTTTLLIELLILAVGSTMTQNSAFVTSFCLFTCTALIVGYILCLTLYIAILSIDIRRAELADLANNYQERAHEPVPYESEETLSYFYAQQYHQRQMFKSRRAVNALLVCIVLLLLHFYEPTTNNDAAVAECTPPDMFAMQKYYTTISKQFWSILNPSHSPVTLKVQPPAIIAIPFSDDNHVFENTVRNLSTCYSQKFGHFRQQQQHYHYTFLDSLHPLILVSHAKEYMNTIPTLILYSMFIGIILWMIPSVRKRVLSPCLHAILLRIVQLLSYTPLPRFLIHDPSVSIASHSNPLFIGGESSSSSKNEASNFGNSDGSSPHFGAMSLQSQFNKRQNLDSIHHVKVKTLLGMHVADLLHLYSTDQYIVSVGQDGKLVLWDVATGQWVARLDKLKNRGGSQWFAEARPLTKCCGGLYTKSQTRSSDYSERRSLSHPQCAQISPDNKYVAAGFENGTVCVWNTSTLQLIHELNAENDHHQQQRTLLVQFLEQQTFVSVHKDNSLHEWNVQTGKRIHSLKKTGHTRHITHMFVLPDKSTESLLVWTASGKEGLVKCWRRYKNPTENRWEILYSIKNSHCITSLIAGQLQDKSGILVLGSTDGAVQVYDYLSGEYACTLSKGGFIKKKENNAEVGGPLLKFSTVAVNEVAEPHYTNKYSRYSSYYDFYQQRLQQPAHQTQVHEEQRHQQQGHDNSVQPALFDHRDSISQVVLTPIRIPEFKNDMCPQCKTTLSLGYFVASSALDGSVHVWRLIKTTTAMDNGCTFCAKKNYYRHSAMKQAAATAKNDSINSGRRKKIAWCSDSSMLRRRPNSNPPECISKTSLQQHQTKSLQPLFLGKLFQLDGRGLVFCDTMVLAGLRRTVRQPPHYPYQGAGDDNLWEVWFTSLQYYEPPSLTTEEAAAIPVVSYSLEKDEDYYHQLQQRRLQEEEERMRQDILKKKRPRRSMWERFLLKFFGIRKVSTKKATASLRSSSTQNRKSQKRLKPTSHNHTSHLYTTSTSLPSSSTSINPIAEEKADVIDNDEEDVDAYEVLPFSSIQHATSTNGQGLSCDYGNFIKVISFGANRQQH